MFFFYYYYYLLDVDLGIGVSLFSIFQLPIMHFVCPQILHKLLFSDSLGRTAHFQNNSLCKIWGANKVHYGQLENRE